MLQQDFFEKLKSAPVLQDKEAQLRLRKNRRLRR
jgi:hypothetical protein